MMKFKGKEYPISVLPKVHVPDVTVKQLDFVQKYLGCKSFTEVFTIMINHMYTILKQQQEYVEKGEIPVSETKEDTNENS